MHERHLAMKILAILAAIVSTTATASAQPKLDASMPSRTVVAPKQPESTGRLLLGDPKPRPAPKAKAPSPVAGWVEITDATPARFGTVFVLVARTAVPLAKLRIDAVTGTVMIQRVKVHYVDGTTNMFSVTKSVSARRQKSAIIDLGNAKQLVQIDITTARRPAGEYAVYGAPAVTFEQTTCC
jgi:hypothetical protein